MTTEIITDLSESILRVQFNRPARKNALTSDVRVQRPGVLGRGPGSNHRIPGKTSAGLRPQEELSPPATRDAHFNTGDIHGCFCHPIDTW
jgi:hypothetical protein